MHRPERCYGDDRGAIGVGDDAAMRPHRLRIDLRNDERHLRVHAEGGGVVHDHGALLHGERRETLGSAPAGGKERDVDTAEAVLLELAYGERLVAEGERLSGGAGGGEETQLGKRETPLLETADELDA